MTIMDREEYIKNKADRLFDHPEFQEDVKIGRTLAGLPPRGISNRELFEAWVEPYVYYEPREAEKPLDDFVTSLLYKYKLSLDWHYTIKWYIYRGRVKDQRLPTIIRVGATQDELTKLWEVVMYIPEDASLADVRAAIPEIKEWQGYIRQKRHKRKRASAYEERNRRAHELRQAGKTYKEVATALVAEGLANTPCTPQDARDYIHGYRQQMEI